MQWFNTKHKHNDTKDSTASFIYSRTRENIKSGEKHSTIFGKIARYFEDLKLVAFTGSYDDLSGKPTAMTPTAHTHTKSQISDFPATMPPAAHTHADYASKSKYGDSTVSVGRKAGTETGGQSFAFGNSVEASGWCSHAEGNICTASGYTSHAEGEGTRSTGFSTHAEGWETAASNYYSHAEGRATTASGQASHAEGSNTTASGYYSHAEGSNTIVSGDYSHAGGKYNVDNTSNIFSIGIGTGTSARKNGLSLNTAGVLKTASTITASTTADYAEYFEWLDGNPDGEDRTGRFVTLEGDRIRLAGEDDVYILGIISGEPFVLGNGDCDVWNGMHERDLFGRVVYDVKPKVVEVPVLDSEKGGIKFETQEVYGKDGRLEYEKVARINPAYDSTQEYIPRAERKEWSPVGMLGMLSVYDDGTCEINGYCRCNKDAVATRSETGYRVIGRLSGNVIRVIVK
ncbi:MAG: hypothetical protein K1W06_11250 [Lachnospiraceae bacterium]